MWKNNVYQSKRNRNNEMIFNNSNMAVIMANVVMAWNREKQY